ncbi:hypothetical protein RRG08_045653 [Elysia crispata]|uniref:Secreted protein n=1 Tax=Elysia crispata TaxID=231223 RepID=A0AAE1D208_9GAST|nr:hypothetical protein RRG08_045653 [Elysia crispata]
MHALIFFFQFTLFQTTLSERLTGKQRRPPYVNGACPVWTNEIAPTNQVIIAPVALSQTILGSPLTGDLR